MSVHSGSLARMVELRKLGKTYEQIAFEVGCEPNTVGENLRRHAPNLTPGRVVKDSTRNRRIAARIAKGMTVGEIAAEMQLSIPTVQGVASRLRKAPALREQRLQLEERIKQLYIEGRRLSAIAHACGISRGTLAGIIHRARGWGLLRRGRE